MNNSGANLASKARRILFVGEVDASVREGALALRDRFGCLVDFAPDGAAACMMAGELGAGEQYRAIIADLRLPDMTGCELLITLQGALTTVPMVMMCGFGYDPAPMLAKARSSGLQGVLMKPLRLDQLLTMVERVAEWDAPAP